ncbi:hypothetical protein [Saccharopolyspora mangrovi]|uniref:Uncharacterized protein n=1 Tax=Saccharopolyspora mangrovi TaxID=3082379 RepID=A0ABU6A4Z0_9PSEU|nr:hypothetical protein [Saccharopolyspora sp. S2-29]MEB3366531.1 hypothetical protein [Saccharopolyspora sp. S2-29]
MDNDSRDTEQQAQTGFTAVLCDDCAHDDGLPILDALGNSVRRSPHGILVRSPCQLGPLWCHTRKNSQRTNGPMLLLQPCDTDRQPIGPVITVGPIRTPNDLAAIARWLETAPTSVTGLPKRLLQALTDRRRASTN